MKALHYPIVTKKTVSSYFLLLVIQLLFFAAGCSKKTEEPSGNCSITKSYAQGDTSQTAINFAYDGTGKLKSIRYPGPPGTEMGVNIFYEDSSVTVKDKFYSTAFSRYYLNKDTLAYSSANYNQGIQTDTSTFFYDNARNLLKVIRLNNVHGKDSAVFAYSNQNLILIEIFHQNGAIDRTVFEYGTLTSKEWYYKNITPFLPFEFYYPWFGAANKNLAVSFTSTYTSSQDPVLLSYTMTGNGYIDNYTQKIFNTFTKTFFEYKCK